MIYLRTKLNHHQGNLHCNAPPRNHANMQKRTLGNTRRGLPTIGLGCMGMSEFYGPPMEHSAAIKLLHEAVELGIEHFDTAEMCGIGGANETLLGEAFADRRDRVFIATKFGPTRNFETGELIGLDGSRENCRRAIEGSLQRLRTDHVDLYYLHRVDPAIRLYTTESIYQEVFAARHQFVCQRQDMGTAYRLFPNGTIEPPSYKTTPAANLP
jgi:aryl-alcohol dehydrogenase-like predicted oxidoreductase